MFSLYADIEGNLEELETYISFDDALFHGFILATTTLSWAVSVGYKGRIFATFHRDGCRDIAKAMKDGTLTETVDAETFTSV